VRSLLIPVLLCLASATHCQEAGLPTSDPVSQGFNVERLNRIDLRIKQYIDSGWLKGADALIARNGRIVYNKAFGIASTEPTIPLGTNAIFRIASQTKAITSVAIMMLFEQGLLLLDDPVSKYIPSMAHPVVLDHFSEKDTTYTTVAAKREVTLRDLLTHTSGIDYAQIGSEKMKAIYAKAGILAGFVSDRIKVGDNINKLGKLPLVHQPGERFTYGLNTDVLGYVVERISGETLDQYFRKHIFEPLGMNDTYFYLPPGKSSRLVAVFTPDKQNNLIRWNSSTFYHISADYPKSKGTYYSGGAGLSSTMRDYAIFLQMVLNHGEYNGKRLLARRTVDLMTSNQIGNLTVDKDKFGLGFRVTTKAGEAKLGQSEGSFSWGGFYGTTYWADPKEHLIGLIFAQEYPFPHGEISDKFIAMVYQALQ